MRALLHWRPTAGKPIRVKNWVSEKENLLERSQWSYRMKKLSLILDLKPFTF